jgi:hypothetical protein
MFPVNVIVKYVWIYVSSSLSSHLRQIPLHALKYSRMNQGSKLKSDHSVVDTSLYQANRQDNHFDFLSADLPVVDCRPCAAGLFASPTRLAGHGGQRNTSLLNFSHIQQINALLVEYCGTPTGTTSLPRTGPTFYELCLRACGAGGLFRELHLTSCMALWYTGSCLWGRGGDVEQLYLTGEDCFVRFDNDVAFSPPR